MNKKLTPEERAFLEYIREKTNNNEFHRFYPNDIVMGNKTIDDFESVIRELKRIGYINGGGWQTDTATKDPNKQTYLQITVSRTGLHVLCDGEFVERLGTPFDSKTQLPLE